MSETDLRSQPRRVAFAAYFFPPVGGGGTPRSLKFVKYLPDWGYRPIVFTVKPEPRDFNREFQPDESASGELDTEAFDLQRIPDPRQKWAWLESSRYFPLVWAVGYPWLYDRACQWARQMAKQIVKIGRARPFDILYASSGPVCSLPATAWAARKLNRPWVADLRDLWTRDTLKFYPSRWHYLWESRLEKRVLRSASAVIANTPLSAKRLSAWLGDDVAERVHIIRNGWDDNEMAGKGRDRQNAGRDSITLVHAGTLYEPRLQNSRRGRFRPDALDNTARSLEPVARGLAHLKRTCPEIARRVKVRLVGFVPDASPLLRELGVADQFSFSGVVPRGRAVQEANAADVLLAVQVAWAQPHRPMPYIPGKVYDYLATGSPILAPVGPGDLRDLLADVPQAYCCDYSRPAEIADQLQQLIDDVDHDRVRVCSQEWLGQFSRRLQTQQLARIFDDALATRDPLD